MNGGLLRHAKQHAAKTGRSLTALIEDAVRAALAPARPPSKRRRVVLPTFPGDGVQSGVDLHDGAALAEIIDAARS